MAPLPDGMAEEAHAEIDNMKAARHDAGPDFTHDVVAVSESGETLFETEALFPNETEGALDDYPEGENAPDGVDHYEIRER